MAHFSWQLGLISGRFVKPPGPADPYDGAHSTDSDDFGLELHATLLVVLSLRIRQANNLRVLYIFDSDLRLYTLLFPQEA